MNLYFFFLCSGTISARWCRLFSTSGDWVVLSSGRLSFQE